MGVFVLGEESVSDEGSSVWNPIMAWCLKSLNSWSVIQRQTSSSSGLFYDSIPVLQMDLTGNTKNTQQKLGTANFFWSMESLTEVLHSFFSVRLVWQSVVQFRCVSLLSCLLCCLLTLLFCNQPFVVSELIKRNVYLFQNKELNFHCTTKLLVNM